MESLDLEKKKLMSESYIDELRAKEEEYQRKAKSYAKENALNYHQCRNCKGNCKENKNNWKHFKGRRTKKGEEKFCALQSLFTHNIFNLTKP